MSAESRHDNSAALILSVAVHALFVAGLALATLSCQRYNALVESLGLPQWAGVTCVNPVSEQGPIIEASLVPFKGPPLPAPRVDRTRPQPAKPVVKPQPPKPETKPELPQLPPQPPQNAQDTIDQERIDKLALERAKQAMHEQDEKVKKDQLLLEEEERQTRMEQERIQQLEDIRRQREAAEAKSREEAAKLAKLEQQQSTVDSQRAQAPNVTTQAQTQATAGNEGVDNTLVGQYKLAIQRAVVANWLRPEAVQSVQCKVRIIQIPGGDVLSATVVPPCATDDGTRQSMESAVMRAQPLPYQGYESVFARELLLNFCYPESLCNG